MFRISAKQGIQNNEIKGPTVFKKTKDVEYTIFLPYDIIICHEDAPRHALRFLFKGMCDVFHVLEIDTAKIVNAEEGLIESICSDRTMLEDPSWDETVNQRLSRKVFTAFFAKIGKEMGSG